MFDLEEITNETDLTIWINDALGCLTDGYDDAPTTEDMTAIVIFALKTYLLVSQKNARCFLPTFGSLLIRAENQAARMSMLQESLLFCENYIS